MTEPPDTEPASLPATTPPPPEDPTVMALSRIEGALDELKAISVAQAERTAKFMEIAEKCFDQCLISQQSSEEVARNFRDHERRLQHLEDRHTLLPPPNGSDG